MVIGGAPVSAARSGLSTTARIATPVRVDFRRYRRPIAAATIATTKYVTSSQFRRAPKIVMNRSPQM